MKEVYCPKCNSRNDASRYYCSACNFNLQMEYEGASPGTLQSGRVEQESTSAAVAAASEENNSTVPGTIDVSRFEERYSDGYSASKMIEKSGKSLQSSAVMLGVFAAISALIGFDSWMLRSVGVFSSLMVGLFIYNHGVFLSAQGQLIRATLDVAVNTSPLLRNDDKARVLELI